MHYIDETRYRKIFDEWVSRYPQNDYELLFRTHTLIPICSQKNE